MIPRKSKSPACTASGSMWASMIESRRFFSSFWRSQPMVRALRRKAGPTFLEAKEGYPVRRPAPRERETPGQSGFSLNRGRRKSAWWRTLGTPATEDVVKASDTRKNLGNPQNGGGFGTRWSLNLLRHPSTSAHWRDCKPGAGESSRGHCQPFIPRSRLHHCFRP